MKASKTGLRVLMYSRNVILCGLLLSLLLIAGCGGSDSNSSAPAPVSNWPTMLSSTGQTYIYSTAVDRDGNVYIAGSAIGSIDGQAVAGTQDGFIAKFNAYGAKQWVKLSGSTQTGSVSQVLCDSAGNVFVTGYLNNSDGSGYMAKYDGNGAEIWRDDFVNMTIFGIALDSSENIYGTGITQASIDGEPYAGAGDAFIAKFDTAGTRQWAKLLGTDTLDYGSRIALDAVGNIFVAGSTFGDLDGNSRIGGQDIFLAKFDPAGTKQWTILSGTSDTDYVTNIAMDEPGNIYIAGFSQSGVTAQTYLVKFDSIGQKQWEMGKTGARSIRDVTVNTAGSIFVTGSIAGSSDPGFDAYIEKINGDGLGQWIRLIASNENDAGQTITIDAAGNIFVAGITQGSIDGRTEITGAWQPFVDKVSAADVWQ